MKEEKMVFILMRLWPTRPADSDEIFGVYEDILDAIKAKDEMDRADPFLTVLCKTFFKKGESDSG